MCGTIIEDNNFLADILPVKWYSKGKIIYAICMHGIEVVDERTTDQHEMRCK